MIEPLRGHPKTFDISCTACGVVHRLQVLAYWELLPRLKAKGWRILAGRHFCPECRESEAA